jgi:hypothetical protein
VATDAKTKPKRRWFQFSVRMLLVFVTLISIAFIWQVVKTHQLEQVEREAVAAAEAAKRQRERDAAAALVKSGAIVTWSALGATCDGKEFPVSVISVGQYHIMDGNTEPWIPSEADMKCLKEFSELRELDLSGAERAASVGLENLNGLKQLQELDLSFNLYLKDSDLEFIEGLDHLRILILSGDYGLTDAGLEHLKGLLQLKELYIRGTNVTDEGVKKLRRALPNCKIDTETMGELHGSTPAN